MKKNEEELCEKITMLFWGAFGLCIGISLIIICIQEGNKREEKECWDYYLKNKIVLISCEKYIKEEGK